MAKEARGRGVDWPLLLGHSDECRCPTNRSHSDRLPLCFDWRECSSSVPATGIFPTSSEVPKTGIGYRSNTSGWLRAKSRRAIQAVMPRRRLTTKGRRLNQREEYIAFYKELGLAVAQWATVEYALAQLVCLCLTSREQDKWMLYQGFHAIENFRSKLQFAETLILEKFRSSQNIGEWDPLSRRLQRASAGRNKLVHRLVVDIPIGGDPGRRFALVPNPKPDLEPKKRPHTNVRKPPPGSLCLRDVNALIHEFRACFVHLVNFAARVRGLEEPFPVSDEQAKNPSTIQSLNAQIHEVLGHPPKPSRRRS